jgi:hypothetical protein
MSQRLRSYGARREHALIVATVVVAIAVVVAGGIAAALTLTGGGTPGPPVSIHRSASSTTAPGHSTVGASTGTSNTSGGSTSRSAQSSEPPASTPRSSAPTGASGGAPRVRKVSPSSGASGQTVEVTGSGFFSSDGRITASFGGAPAPTSCPTQSSCTVTVPNLGSAHATTMTIVTSSGTSNAITFTYR